VILLAFLADAASIVFLYFRDGAHSAPHWSSASEGPLISAITADFDLKEQ